MLLRYEPSSDDWVALVRLRNARTGKTDFVRSVGLFIVPAVIVVSSIFLQACFGVSSGRYSAIAVVLAMLCAGFFYFRYPVIWESWLRKRLAKDSSTAEFGPQELEISEDCLTHRSTIQETRHQLRAIERVDEIEDFVYVVVTSGTYIIPKRSVTFGDMREFVAEVRRICPQAVQDRPAKGKVTT